MEVDDRRLRNEKGIGGEGRRVATVKIWKFLGWAFDDLPSFSGNFVPEFVR